LQLQVSQFGPQILQNGNFQSQILNFWLKLFFTKNEHFSTENKIQAPLLLAASSPRRHRALPVWRAEFDGGSYDCLWDCLLCYTWLCRCVRSTQQPVRAWRENENQWRYQSVSQSVARSAGACTYLRRPVFNYVAAMQSLFFRLRLSVMAQSGKHTARLFGE